MDEAKSLEPVASLFNALYEQFIARDIFSKIGPGLILLLALAISVAPEKANVDKLKEVSGWLWLGIFTTAWFAGFAAQGFGVMTRTIRYFPSPEACTQKDYEDLRQQFLEKANEFQRRQGERFRLVKEACGNAYVAIFLSLIISLLGNFLTASPDKSLSLSILEFLRSNWHLMLYAAVAVISLAKVHFDHGKVEWMWMELVLSSDRRVREG